MDEQAGCSNGYVRLGQKLKAARKERTMANKIYTAQEMRDVDGCIVAESEINNYTKVGLECSRKWGVKK